PVPDPDPNALRPVPLALPGFPLFCIPVSNCCWTCSVAVSLICTTDSTAAAISTSVSGVSAGDASRVSGNGESTRSVSPGVPSSNPPGISTNSTGVAKDGLGVRFDIQTSTTRKQMTSTPLNKEIAHELTASYSVTRMTGAWKSSDSEGITL